MVRNLPGAGLFLLYPMIGASLISSLKDVQHKWVSLKISHGQESLKIHYIEFYIAVPLCKMYIKYIMSKIKMRPYNSVRMGIRCIVFSVITVYDQNKYYNYNT